MCYLCEPQETLRGNHSTAPVTLGGSRCPPPAAGPAIHTSWVHSYQWPTCSDRSSCSHANDVMLKECYLHVALTQTCTGLPLDWEKEVQLA